MTEKKNIEIGKIDLEKEHTFFPIKELPVKSTDMVRIEIAGTSWEDSICYLALVHWKEIGYITLYEKETLINATIDGYKKITYEKPKETYEKIRKSIESLILQGIFKEEIKGQEEWLIPLKPLLKCASPLAKEPEISWCLMYNYYDINVSLS